MASNNINRIRGTSDTFEIDITDENGEPIPSDKFIGAKGEFILKTSPTAPTNMLDFTTADPAHLLFDPARSKLILNLLPTDDGAFPLAVYVYQVSVTLGDGSYYVVIPFSLYDLNLGGVAQPPPPAFDNTVKLDHNWELPDSLRYVTPGGTPIAGAQVRVYYKTDYDAGQLQQPVGVTLTDAFGRWTNPVLVLPGYSYVVQFLLPNQFGPDTAQVIA